MIARRDLQLGRATGHYGILALERDGNAVDGLLDNIINVL
jgi:hypothetical protein